MNKELSVAAFGIANSDLYTFLSILNSLLKSQKISKPVEIVHNLKLEDKHKKLDADILVFSSYVSFRQFSPILKENKSIQLIFVIDILPQLVGCSQLTILDSSQLSPISYKWQNTKLSLTKLNTILVKWCNKKYKPFDLEPSLINLVPILIEEKINTSHVYQYQCLLKTLKFKQKSIVQLAILSWFLNGFKKDFYAKISELDENIKIAVINFAQNLLFTKSGTIMRANIIKYIAGKPFKIKTSIIFESIWFVLKIKQLGLIKIDLKKKKEFLNDSS